MYASTTPSIGMYADGCIDHTRSAHLPHRELDSELHGHATKGLRREEVIGGWHVSPDTLSLTTIDLPFRHKGQYMLLAPVVVTGNAEWATIQIKLSMRLAKHRLRNLGPAS